MTDKKENIIKTALSLFANEGFNAVSTSKIAKEAAVSEGLIFRHFVNKKGLLNAIMKDTEVRISQVFAVVLFETNPEEVIRKTIELPFSIAEKEYSFWKLQFKLKWEDEYYNPNKMKPVFEKLTWAFEQLEYKTPDQEAELLNHIIESISIHMIRNGRESQRHLKALLLKKYQL